MAKKSKSKARSKSGLKLPKEVAGVKVPKGLRKQAKNLLEIIDTPAGRELAAAGLTLAATALAAKSTDSQAKGAAKAVARQVVGKARSTEGDVADLGAILSAAVTEGARRFVEGFEEGKRAKTQKLQNPVPRQPRAGSGDRPDAKDNSE